jgi:hypothetical protein
MVNEIVYLLQKPKGKKGKCIFVLKWMYTCYNTQLLNKVHFFINKLKFIIKQQLITGYEIYNKILIWDS